MYPDNIYAKLNGWSEHSLQHVRELLPLMSPVSRHQGWSADERRILGYLLSACARSSESALLLVAFAQLWDAEVLVRSATEGSLKFMYLLQSAETFKARHREYAHDLFRVAMLKDHNKASELLGSIPDPGDRRWKPIRDRLLSADEAAAIGAEYDARRRRALETGWGFAGLLGTMARSGDPVFNGVLGLAHGYAMASHVTHADFVGTSLALDREMREPVRRDAMLLAHGVKLLSNVLSALKMRLLTGYRFIETDPAPIFVAWEKLVPLEAEFEDVREAWMDVEYGAEIQAPL